MLIQIDRAGFVNKGAELMLRAIFCRLSSEKSLNAEFSIGQCAPDLRLLRRIGAHKPITDETRLASLLNLIPDNLLRMIRRVKLARISCVLDAGGFVHGDQWPATDEEIRIWRKYYEKLKSNGTRIIFMPQAFGPFEKPASRMHMEALFPYADLIFARDPQSYAHLTGLCGQDAKIRLAPDFTNIYLPGGTEHFNKIAAGAVLVIPNSKMLTQTALGDAYLDNLHALCAASAARGRRLVFLSHEGAGDMEIIQRLHGTFPSAMILNGLDADEVKAAIGHAYLVICSRFHGVVSALSQSVPTLVTGWSHKYEYLMRDYALERGLMNLNDMQENLLRLENMLDADSNTRIRKELAVKSSLQRVLTERMWNDVLGYMLP